MSVLSRVALVALVVSLGACSSSKTATQTAPDRDTGLIPDVADTGVEEVGVDAMEPEVSPDVATDVPTDTEEVEEVRECETSFGTDMETEVLLVRGGRVDLSVTLEDCDGPVSNALITFDYAGNTAGSLLRNTRARTDDNGDATVELVAGDTNTTFQIVATDGTDFVTFDVTVEGSSLGNIEARIVDESDAGGVTSYSAYLFVARGCSSIHRFDPLGALEVVEPITALGRPTRFEELAPAGNYTVAVQAHTEAGVIGFGCVDGVAVADLTTTEVTVDMSVIPPAFDGIYELDNRFDLADTLPDSVANTLRVLDELTDDHHVRGNAAQDSWGVDPAAFILDFVYSEICCWTALDTDPDTPGFQGNFATCQAQEFTHARGDLEMIYRHDFTSWDGAQPSSSGLCGAVALGNVPLQNLVQGLIEDFIPDAALNLLDIVGDLSRAITDMNIISELRVGDISSDKIGQFVHVLREMHVELHDLDGEVNTHVFLLIDAGLANLEYTDNTSATDEGVLTIPEHSFRLDFGRLVRYIYTDILLPTLDCDRDHDGITTPCTSTADLFGTWVDCSVVGEWLYNEFPFVSETAYTNVCNAGVDAAGLAVEETIQGSIDAETIITLEGTVSAGELNEERKALTLVNGQWDGQLVEDDTSYGAFPGTFTGVRTHDVD